MDRQGRNEPCWCGSGRKYKKCHLGNEQATLLERSDWLYAKAVQHVMHSDWDELLTDVRVTRARAARDEETMLRSHGRSDGDRQRAGRGRWIRRIP
ncbi:SEC-C metal-binding domain-containing protein [Mycolicibacterium phocaicum]|uniref:SEC-C metal-binding domain-containing protein n=1 Tax=Mycolicibacterium phocaicum TaxID=319706 RepID=UPI0038996D42